MKKTITGKELGASEIGTIILGKNSYGQTDNDVLDKHKRASIGVSHIRENEYSRPLTRGKHLEAGIVNWWLEETFAKQKVKIVADELDFAVRMEREKIGATLDRLIKINGELEVDGEVFTGEGVLEIKTDYYHQNKPKIEWIYQVNQQLICVNKTLDKKLTWGLIVCACQKGKLHTYPVKLNKKYIKDIFGAAITFWNHFDYGTRFPEPEEKQEDKKLDIRTLNPEHIVTFNNENYLLVDVIDNYLNAKREERQSKKTTTTHKEILDFAIDQMNCDGIQIDKFHVVAERTTKERTEQRGTGQFYDTRKPIKITEEEEDLNV
mgnify:FL=1